MSKNIVEKSKEQWVRIEAMADSGAGETVGPKTIAPHIPIRPKTAAMGTISYVAANGTRIGHHGEKTIMGVNDEGMPSGMIMQVADVQKLLAAVSQICDAGNKVVFDNNGAILNVRKQEEKRQ